MSLNTSVAAFGAVALSKFFGSPGDPRPSKHSHGDVNASPHHHVVPLGHRADAHGGRSHSARHTTRSKGTYEISSEGLMSAASGDAAPDDSSN